MTDTQQENNQKDLTPDVEREDAEQYTDNPFSVDENDPL
jgi:hypothetical protein